MAVNDVAPSRAAAPPTPEECPHSHPIRGVMAHEFSHYEGAQGPEGKRRTTTYYGPVVGGLPIEAWYCEECGLLRLTYPDGRREERRLHPGPQPGLIARASAVDPDATRFGMQARVSGLSLSPQLATELVPVAIPVSWASRVTIPQLGAVAWASVALLTATAAGLLLAGILAVYDYTTSPAEGVVVLATVAAFAAFLALQVAGAGFRKLFPMPDLTPSPALTGRERPQLSAAAKSAVSFLVISIIGLLAAAILAVYDYQTSPLEGLVSIVTLISFTLAVVFLIASAIGRALHRR